MPFIGNAGQASNIYEKNYATTTLRIVEGDAAYQSYNPADSHYKLITNLESITAVGSTSSNTVHLTNAHIGYTTVANVGIMNTSPIHTLDIGANVYIDEFGSNVVYVKGNIFSENIQTTDIVADQEISCRDLTAFNVVRSDDTVTNQIFPRTTTFLHITSNTGVLNSAPQHTLSVSDKLIIDKDGSNIVYVHGNTYSDHLKAPIATIENVFTNNVYAKSDNIVHIGSNVGIMNSNPIHTLVVGSNVQIDDVGSNTFWTGGNVYAQRYSGTEINLTGTIVASDFILSGGSQSTPTPQLQTVSEVNPQIGEIQFSSDKTLTLTNVTKGLNVASNITTMTLYGNVVSENVYSTGNITVGTSNLFVDTSVGRVGINKSSPVKELDVTGEIAGSGDLAIGTNKLFVDVSEGRVGINKSSPVKELDVTGEIACSSNLAVNIDKLFVDANAGRVGINKSSPTEALDVVGKISGTDDLAVGTDKLFVDVSESRVGINNSSPTEALDVVGKISGTDDLAIGTNKLFVDVSEGRVGINKSSPTKALDVVGEIVCSSNLTVNMDKLFVNANAGRVGINKSSPTKALDVTGEIACSSDFTVDTNKLFVNTETGRIGINRNDPGKNLDIAGDFRCSSDLQVGSVAKLFVDVSESCVGINKSTPSRALDVVGKIAGTDDLVIGTDKLFVDVGEGRVGINKSAPLKALDVVGEIAGTDDLVIGTDKLFVDVSTSRVGINKSAPLKALDVTGEIACSSHLTVGGNLTVNTDDFVVDTVNSRVGINKSAPSKALDVTGEIQASSHATIGGNLTVNTDDLVVDTANSRVGINKSTPSKALDVTGEIECSSHLTVGGDLIVNGTTTTVNTSTLSVKDTLIELGKDNTSGTSDLGLVMTRPGSNVAVFYNEGTDKLQIGHTLNGAGDSDITLDSGTRLPVNIQGDLEVGTANLFVDTMSSNVGVGTNSPAFTLDVVGDINFAGNLYQGASEFVSSLWTSNGDTLYYSTTNVAIGNSFAAYELHVEGNVYASEDITAFSDARLKENVEPIGRALEKVCSIGGYTYNKIGDTRRNAGVLAQEVMTVLPEVVHGSEDTNYSVAYGNMVSLLIEAIKELKLEIDELKKSK